MPRDFPTPIRNLTTLKADMVQELRQALEAIEEWQRIEAGNLSFGLYERKDRLAWVERKVRNVLEYLTGDRE